MDKNIEKQLEALGFQVIGTGGGCTAWSKEHHGFEILISDDASADLNGEYCSIHVFDQDDVQCMHMESTVADLPQRVAETFILGVKE